MNENTSCCRNVVVVKYNSRSKDNVNTRDGIILFYKFICPTCTVCDVEIWTKQSTNAPCIKCSLLHYLLLISSLVFIVFVSETNNKSTNHRSSITSSNTFRHTQRWTKLQLFSFCFQFLNLYSWSCIWILVSTLNAYHSKLTISQDVLNIKQDNCIY